ncbi:MAG: hypothetical protein V2J02_10660 [Pseudomonadales bacterium]|jgi:hypothetical protein|nr:hypothetical protein [Pseudomonadales bacterium]
MQAPAAHRAAAEAERPSDAALAEPKAPRAAADHLYSRTTTTKRSTLVGHAPQIESGADFERLTAWGAIALTRGATGVTYSGSAHCAAKTDTDLFGSAVLLHDLCVETLNV